LVVVGVLAACAVSWCNPCRTRKSASYSAFSDSDESSHLMDEEGYDVHPAFRDDRPSSPFAAPAAAPAEARAEARAEASARRVALPDAGAAGGGAPRAPPAPAGAGAGAGEVGSLLDLQAGGPAEDPRLPAFEPPAELPFEGPQAVLSVGSRQQAFSSGRPPSEMSFAASQSPSAASGLGPAQVSSHQAHLRSLMPRGFGHGLTAAAFDAGAAELLEAPSSTSSFAQGGQKQEAMRLATSTTLGGRAEQPQQLQQVSNSRERILGSSWQPLAPGLAGDGAAAARGHPPPGDDALQQYAPQPQLPAHLQPQAPPQQPSSWMDVQASQPLQAAAQWQAAPWGDVRLGGR